MEINRLKLFQLLLESAIPLLGYFLWDWNLYFILLFYIMDLLADEVIFSLKCRDIIRVGRAQFYREFYRLLASGLAFIAILAIIHLALYLMNPAVDFKEEFVQFWTYEELGLQQGYLLLPLVAVGAYQKYKIEFKLRKTYLVADLKDLWLKHMRGYFFITALAILIVSINYLFVPGDLFYVLLIIASVAAYKILSK